MTYKNEEYIKQFFEGVHEEETKAELDEVYKKAEALDEIYRTMEDFYEVTELDTGNVLDFDAYGFGDWMEGFIRSVYLKLESGDSQ